MIFPTFLVLKKMQSRLIDSLKETYTWDEICKANPDIPCYVSKWDQWLAECKETRMIEDLPFTDKELEYLNSPLLDGLKELHDLDVVDAYENASTPSVITWIWSNFREIERRASRISLISNLCREGHLETLKWIHSKYSRLYVPKEAVINACFNHHFEVVKWLYEIYPQQVWLMEAFGRVCVQNELTVAKFLLELDRDEIVEFYSSPIGSHNEFIGRFPYPVSNTFMGLHSQPERYIEKMALGVSNREIFDWLQEYFDIDEKFRQT